MTQTLGHLSRELSLPYYEDALPAHDHFHAKRVHDVAIRLADECESSVDTEILSAAAWLHDIGRPQERIGVVENHGEWAATEAAELLSDEAIPPNQIEAIKHCLRSHSIRSTSPDPNSIEAKLLFDADKLDATGARGLIRLACIIGERSGRTGGRYAVIDDASILGFDSFDGPDISLLREWARERLDALYTEPGCQLGNARWRFMEEFFTQFNRELQGEL